MSSPYFDEALRRSEEFAARLIESSRDCIKVLHLKGHLLSVNTPLHDGVGDLRLRFPDRLALVRILGRAGPGARRAAIEQARQGQVGRFIGYFPTMQTKPPMWLDVSP